MASEPTPDETAFHLIWLSQWKLQQESSHIEPMLHKMLGHLSIYNQAAQYMAEHDVSNNISTFPLATDIDVGQVEDFIFGENNEETSSDVLNEFSSLLAQPTTTEECPPPESISTLPSQACPTASLTDSGAAVVITSVEIDVSHNDPSGTKNPFSDDEETDEGDGEDDIGWSSDDETEFGSVSSVEDESEAEHRLRAKLSTIAEEEGEADGQGEMDIGMGGLLRVPLPVSVSA